MSRAGEAALTVPPRCTLEVWAEPLIAEAVASAIAAIESLPGARVISVVRVDSAGAEELQHSA